jgi:TonB family protein
MTPLDLDHLARTFLTILADVALRGVVIASVIGIAILLLRGKGAALRLRAWTIVLVAAIALPAIGLIVPAWSWQIPTLQIQETWSPAPAVVQSTTRNAGTVSSTVPVRPAVVGVTAPMVAVGIYLAGVLLLLLQACLAWFTTRQLQRSARPIVDASAVASLKRHASAAGLVGEPRLLESSKLFVPITMSVMRPVVALPDDWRAWPAGRLDAVLAHEVSHVARRDALTQRLSLFYRAVLWCSPLSWWLHRHIGNLSEQASDEAALHAGVAPTTYAETLLAYFTQLQNQPRRAEWHLAMARRADADAARRVERILAWKGGRMMTRSKWWLVGILVVAVPVVAVTASVRLASVKTAPPTLAALPVSAPAVMAQPSATSLVVLPTTPVEKSPRVPAPVVTRPAAVDRARSTEHAQVAEAQQSGRPTGSVLPDDDFTVGTYEPGNGVSWPQAIREVKPKYTPDAMRAKLQGRVELELVIMPDGTVGKVRVLQSLDRDTGLDEAAVAAARQWVFTPGKLNGEAVPVRVLLSLEFRLH